MTITVAAARAAFNRRRIWLCKLRLDRCTLEYGVGACTASGGSCGYTFPTCADPTNYSLGTYDWTFINRGAPLIPGALPLLRTFDPIATRINQDKFTVEAGEMRLRFAHDTASPRVAAEKSGSPADAGLFWPNLLARNPNYEGRLCELHEGYDGVDPDDFELVFRGVLTDFSVDRDGAEISARDFLGRGEQEEMKLPPQIDDDNVVEDNPLAIGATTVNVTDASQFLAASTKHPRHVKIESEYIRYTGRDTVNNHLTGCTRGACGSAAAEHAVGAAVAQVLAYGSTDWSTGITPDLIHHDLLYLGGILPDYWETYDEGVTLSAALSDVATTASLDRPWRLPDSGVLVVGDEWMSYTSRDDSGVAGLTRGLWGTTAAAHSDDDLVLLSKVTAETGRWHQNCLFGPVVIEAETGVSDLVGSLAADNMADAWVNESGRVDWAIQAPPAIGTDATALTRDDHWRDSRKVDQNAESRCTRVYVYHSAAAPDPGEEATNYGGVRALVGVAEEAAVWFGRPRRKLRFCRWICRWDEADWLATRLLSRYRRAGPIVTFSVETVRAGIKVGDLVSLTVPEIVNPLTGAAATRTYRVTRKEWRPESLNEVVIEATDSGYGDERYGLIAPEMGTLHSDITDAYETITVIVGDPGDGEGNGRLCADDFRVGGEIRIGDEKITVGNAVDSALLVDGTPEVILFGCARGAQGTTPAAHSEDDRVLILWSGASDNFRRMYAFIGDTDNLLGGEPGFVIW